MRVPMSVAATTDRVWLAWCLLAGAHARVWVAWGALARRDEGNRDTKLGRVSLSRCHSSQLCDAFHLCGMKHQRARASDRECDQLQSTVDAGGADVDPLRWRVACPRSNNRDLSRRSAPRWCHSRAADRSPGCDRSVVFQDEQGSPERPHESQTRHRYESRIVTPELTRTALEGTQRDL